MRAVHRGFDRDQRRSIVLALSTLASPSPVSSYVPLEALDVLSGVLGSSRVCFSEGEREVLQAHAPLLYGMVAVMSSWENLVVDSPCQLLLKELVRLSRLCVTSKWPQSLADPDCSGQPSSSSHACLKSGICCGLKEVRARPFYKMDKPLSDEEFECRHSFKAGSKGSHRTGGVFTWFCKHGICYAFFIIPDAEGRNEAFSFMIRFFARAPKLIVYDFACSLQEYCLNREPEFFGGTKFGIDRFHLKNHKSCGGGYCLSHYLQYDYLNTEIAEQCNSALQKVKPSLAQMNQEYFMFSLRLFLEGWNAGKVSQLRVAQNHINSI